MFGHDTPRLTVRITAALALAADIAIHADLAPDHLKEVPYLGALFVELCVLLTAVLIGVIFAPRLDIVWIGGAALSGGAAVAFIISRTVGLPDVHETWTSDGGLGLASLPAAAIFLICAFRGRRTALSDWFVGALPRQQPVVASGAK
jgi:hypothetical protein